MANNLSEFDDFREEIKFLQSVFETVSSSVIATVLESCNGDVHLAADTIMNLNIDKSTDPLELVEKGDSEDSTEVLGNTQTHGTLEPILPQQPPTTSPVSSETQDLSVTFSETLRNTGAVPKKPLESKAQKPCYKNNPRPDQIETILNHYNEGSRILILMRGAAGSGKTYLAKHIIDYTVGASTHNYTRHIFSADSYFMRGGVYLYNKNALHDAHTVNQRKVFDATNGGVSPIIVDNTNMELWEMEPYVRDGVRNGYIIEIVEPNTPWAKNANQLAKKNIHGVSRDAIRRMLDRYEKRITPESLLKSLRLAYPTNKKPPVKRNIPPISSSQSSLVLAEKTPLNIIEYDSVTSSSNIEIFHYKSPDSPDRQINDKISTPSNDDELLKIKKIIEVQQNLEHFQKIEQEWDNGEGWDTGPENMNTALQDQAIALNPKPPRRVEKTNNDKLIGSATICDDWTKISMFMPPWQDHPTSSNLDVTLETPVKIETKSVGTAFEVDDMNEDIHKVLYGRPRNINEGILEQTRSKIPKMVMLDKSTATNENDLLIKKEQCKNKEHHFRQLRKLFKPVPRHILRDIFESCNCDSNWTFDLIHGFYPGMQDDTENLENISDSDEELNEEPIEDCNCLAAYNIIPDMEPTAPVLFSPDPTPKNPPSTPVTQKKTKKENKLLSDSSLQLKRQIESNVMISDSHYSQHYLNMRKRRENNQDTAEKDGELSQFKSKIEDANNINMSGGAIAEENAVALPESYTQSVSHEIRDIVIPSTSQYNFQFMDSIDTTDSDTETDSNNSDNIGKATVPITLGAEFLAKLDELFGREGFQYPEYINPVVNLPMSILQQINAHWAMSVASQMDDGSKQSETMIKQDEDFARQLVAKEEEMSQEGEEPDVPSLKEIMDMELAYSIHERDLAEWRNNEPQDLAAKLSREKLYNLFPDLPKDVLSEMLMAHDYSFKATVESLIISTGQASWLEDEKGVEKFVMYKENLRKEKFLEEQKKDLDEAEWPYLGKPGKPINLDTVNYYREEAQKYLRFRNANFAKAKKYFANNSPSAASFYSDIAALHTRKYEQSSCLAAAYLMNYLQKTCKKCAIEIATKCINALKRQYEAKYKAMIEKVQKKFARFLYKKLYGYYPYLYPSLFIAGMYHLMKNPDQNVLDLHFLRVSEAIVNLDIFLDQTILILRNKKINYKETWIITGKGIHSAGGPRIKPAVKRRLKVREIRCKEVNAGLLSALLHPTHKMTDELIHIENS